MQATTGQQVPVTVTVAQGVSLLGTSAVVRDENAAGPASPSQAVVARNGLAYIFQGFKAGKYSIGIIPYAGGTPTYSENIVVTGPDIGFSIHLGQVP